MTAIPYPPDTRAKGWRFELDHERIEQSDTWTLAPVELRPWLLMLWMTSWKQTPCGSLTDDDALIAARLGMAPKLFAKHRGVLMRGWWKADDGRLYHDTIAQRVLEMLAKRSKDAERSANRRARSAAVQEGPHEVTAESRVTPPLVSREFDTKHQAPSTRNQAPSTEHPSGGTTSPRTPRLTPAPAGAVAPPKAAAVTGPTWEAYSDAYAARYTEPPVRNATVNSLLKQVVNRLGEEAPMVAAFYVGHQNRLYVNSGHAVNLLVRDCEKLRTEWATGRQVTSTHAMQADRTQTNLSAFGALLAEAKEREHAQP